jgi:hypothetical protein
MIPRQRCEAINLTRKGQCCTFAVYRVRVGDREQYICRPHLRLLRRKGAVEVLEQIRVRPMRANPISQWE